MLERRMHASMFAVGLAVLMVLSMLSIASVPVAATIEPVWTEEAPLPGARVYPTVVADESGLVYVCGGAVTTVHELPTDSAFTYDSMTGAVEWLAPMPYGVRGGTGAMGEDGKVYVFTGYNDSIVSEVPYTQIYDPETDSWSLGADIPVAMWGARAQLASNGLFYVFGGSDGSGMPQNDVQIYDPEMDSWSSGAVMPAARYHGVAIAWNEYVFYLGGVDSTYATSDMVYYYSVSGNNWYTYDSMPVARWGAAGCLGEDDNLYYLGGNDDWGTYDDGVCLNLRTGEYLDVPAMSVESFYYSAVSVPDGRILVIGGSDWAVMYDRVESMNVADVSVALSTDSVAQGDSVMLMLESDFAFVVPHYQWVEYYVQDGDGTIYVYDYFEAYLWASLSIELALPDTLPLGEYEVVVVEYACYESWSSLIIVEDLAFSLTVVDAYTLEEQIAALEAQIAALETALSTVEGNVSDLATEIADLQAQLTELQTALDEANQDVTDVQTSVDDKMSAVMGYAILGLLIVVIVLMILMMVMGRKAVPPPPAP